MAGGQIIPNEAPARGLDFFIHAEAACRELRELVRQSHGETALQSLQQSVVRVLEWVHDLPMQTLNDKLKRYPFVDPSPMDTQLAEIIDAVHEWVARVTAPYWIVEVAHRVGEAGPVHATAATTAETRERVKSATAAGRLEMATGTVVRTMGLSADLELEKLGRFTYPLPLKLRDLQAMVRPFMEARSVHHISGIDAMVDELIRGLLRLFHTVKAWDAVFAEHMAAMLQAEAAEEVTARNAALLDLCATMELDVFEAAHRLHKIDSSILRLTHGEIEVICQRLPLFLDERVLRGPPTSVLDHGRHGPSVAISAAGLSPAHSARSLVVEGEEPTTLEAIRQECLTWWREQSFVFGAPTIIVAGALLTYLVDIGLHPDPFVAEMLPRVLDRLFGPQISCGAWMNRLLPSIGGYVDSTGEEVPLGEGLPLKSYPTRCAESLLVFLKRWCDLVLGAEEEQASREMRAQVNRKSVKQRFTVDGFLGRVMETGHSVKEVVDLLEGAAELPRSVLEVPDDGRRYRVDDNTARTWELLTAQYLDGLDALEDIHRDLGPYVHLRLDYPEELAKHLPADTKDSWTLINPEVKEAATRGYSVRMEEMEDLPDELEICGDASDTFGIKLADWPPELSPQGGGAASTFIRFFAQDGRRVSRRFMQGLPPLPWSFGTDERNTIIMDIDSRHGVAPFHCLFARARAQPKRAVVVPLGDPMSSSYVVCPKYQPLQVRNGDRLVCHQWSFELRLQSRGPRTDALLILTDEGNVYEVPFEGCHIGAGHRSPRVEFQPYFPPAKFVLTHRVHNMAAVHLVFQYIKGLNRWTIIDHSPDPLGALLLLKPGVAYPLSEGLRLKLGPLVLQVALEPEG